MLTIFLPPKPKWPISLAVLIGTLRRIYAYNILKTLLTPLSLKKKQLTTYLLFIKTLLRYRMPALTIKA
jgi:hypothetical protein